VSDSQVNQYQGLRISIP